LAAIRVDDAQGSLPFEVAGSLVVTTVDDALRVRDAGLDDGRDAERTQPDRTDS